MNSQCDRPHWEFTGLLQAYTSWISGDRCVVGKEKGGNDGREERKREGEELKRVGPFEFVRIHTLQVLLPPLPFL